MPVAEQHDSFLSGSGFLLFLRLPGTQNKNV